MSKSNSVVRFNCPSLKRNEIHSFNNRVLHILETTCGKCGKPYDDFKAAADHYGMLLHDKAFVTSNSLEDYDRKADDAWRGLDLQIAASMKHPQSSVREASKAVHDVFSKTANPTQLSYDEEYGALSVLLSQLGAIDKDVLKVARVDEFVEYLGLCVQDFIDASKKSIDAKSKQQVGALKNAVMGCYKAWQNLAKYLEAMSIADALPSVQDAIDQLNAMNTGIKRRLDARKSSKTEDTTDNIVEIDDGTVAM